MPTGGTLLIGREQDCEGGCFDSAPGETPSVSPAPLGASHDLSVLPALHTFCPLIPSVMPPGHRHILAGCAAPVEDMHNDQLNLNPDTALYHV